MHEQVILRCVLRAVLGADLDEDDVGKLGHKRLHVHG